VSPEIGLQVHENNVISQSHAEIYDNEKNHGDLFINEQQDVSVCEDINQVDGTAQQTIQSVILMMIQVQMMIIY
jgi:hypothetical protein